MARVVAVLLGLDHLPGTTVTRYCASSLQTTRMAFHAIKAGEGDVFVSAGVECVSRFPRGNSDNHPDTRNPRLSDAHARTAARAEGHAERWQRPARRRRVSRRLHRDGADRRERFAAARYHPRDAGRLRLPVAEPGRKGFGRRLLATRDHAGHASRRQCRRPRRRTARRHHDRNARDAAAGVPRRRHGNRRKLLPAQRRRCGRHRHVRHSRTRTRHHAARAHRVERCDRPLAGDHGTRSCRGDQAGTSARRHDDRRCRPRRDQRSVRSAGDTRATSISG